ncbi:MAG: hypothetical protein LBH18_04205 [Spirochaetaceae bacterium]|nr:hypothetical protein [Spirochaetaceae bacterium]
MALAEKKEKPVSRIALDLGTNENAASLDTAGAGGGVKRSFTYEILKKRTNFSSCHLHAGIASVTSYWFML